MPTEIITFGCRLNTYESEVMKAHAHAAGIEDAIVFNTCAVTAEAEAEARRAIRRARRENPNKRIIVTGCAAQIDPAKFTAMEEVDVVLGNHEKLKADEWQLVASHPSAVTSSTKGALLATGDWRLATARVNDIMSVKETASHLVTSFDGRSRAFLQVQNGCDHRCTFCIIPFGRGNARSVPVGEVVAQVQALVGAGYHEVVFTGVDVSSYGGDLPGQPSLGAMMRRVLKLVPELKRLRLSSIDAVEVDDELLRLIAEEPRLMPHLHISIQAGDDMILKRMKRRHLRHDIVKFCDDVRRLRPDIMFGADIIAGFPTETDDMFENTRALVGEVGLSYLHVFPYSARTGTPAARMPQVKKDIRKARAKILREEGARVLAAELKKQVGHAVELIVEQDGITGHAGNFITVKLPQAAPVGSLQRVTIARVDGAVAYAA